MVTSRVSRVPRLAATAVMIACVCAAAVTPTAAQDAAAPAPAATQERVLRFSSAEGSVVQVDGDSTMHKWTVRGRQIDGAIDFRVDAPEDATAEQVVDALVANPRASATAAVPARTLKSTKNDSTMDAKMYGALNVKTHPTLSYELTRITNARRESPTRFAFDTEGKLTVAGTTVTLTTPMNVQMTSDRTLEVTAKFGTLMTDFGVKPPQALGGMIKSHNKVVVTVKWSCKR